MNATASKYAPAAVALLASGACSWPYLGGLAPAAPARPAPPPVTAGAGAGAASASRDLPPALLSPEPSPRPDRNPFLDPERARAEVRAKVVRTVMGWLPTPVASKGVGRKAVVGKSRTMASRDGPVDPRLGLVLNATTADGDRGFAVINGKSFGVGDAVSTADSNRPCLLVEVRAHEVRLLYDGRRWPLGYTAARASGPGRPAPRTTANLALNDDGNQASTAARKGAPARRGTGRRRGARGD